MKKFWVNLLAVLLLAALAMNCAVAEPGEVVILDLDSDVDVQVESTDDGIILDDADLSLDIEDLPTLGEDDSISLDASLEDVEPAADPASNAVVSNDGTEEFEIINGVLVKYNGPGGDVTIPSTVTDIGEKAFMECSSLTSVTIPNSVVHIDESAFSQCTSLTSVSIPNSVKLIEYSAFSGCSSLTTISIPDSVTNMWDGVFYGCSSLTSVNIGNGLTWIESHVFQNCTHLESIVIPANIIRILPSAFKNCYSLMDVTLMNGNIAIGSGAFSGCPTTMTFRTPCESKATWWAIGKGYTVIKSDHTPVADPAVAPTVTESGLTEGSHCAVCGEVLVAQAVIPRLISMRECSISGIGDEVYKGKKIKPAPVVAYNGSPLVEGIDYILSYKNNKAIGTATVTVTGIGNYAESVDVSFKINPKSVALSKLKAGAKQLTVKWKKGKGITGYQVQYSLKKDFSGAKTVTVKKAGTVETVLKKLKTGKTYYVRIRAYATVKGKKYYSEWSKAKSAKVK